MSRKLKLNEYGRTLAFNAGIDISSATSYEVQFTKPEGQVVTVTATLGVSDLTLDDIDGTEVTYLANEYATYIVAAGLLDQAGRWTYKLLAPEAALSVPGDCGSFEVVG